MKKIIIALLFLGIVFAPMAAKAEVLMGEAYTTQIEPMSEIEQLKTELIALITQLIGRLQVQLDQILAQQNTMSQTIQSSVPAPVVSILGCTDNGSRNFNENATKDDGSCEKWPVLTASCLPDSPTVKSRTPVNFYITPSGGTGTYVYQAYFCFNNQCRINSFSSLETGIQTKTINVRSGDQRITIDCSVNVEN